MDLTTAFPALARAAHDGITITITGRPGLGRLHGYPFCGGASMDAPRSVTGTLEELAHQVCPRPGCAPRLSVGLTSLGLVEHHLKALRVKHAFRTPQDVIDLEDLLHDAGRRTRDLEDQNERLLAHPSGTLADLRPALEAGPTPLDQLVEEVTPLPRGVLRDVMTYVEAVLREPSDDPWGTPSLSAPTRFLQDHRADELTGDCVVLLHEQRLEPTLPWLLARQGQVLPASDGFVLVRAPLWAAALLAPVEVVGTAHPAARLSDVLDPSTLTLDDLSAAWVLHDPSGAFPTVSSALSAALAL